MEEYLKDTLTANQWEEMVESVADQLFKEDVESMEDGEFKEACKELFPEIFDAEV